MKTLQYHTDEEVIEMIHNGAKFNGTIYWQNGTTAAAKRNNTKYATIYVDGIKYFIKGDANAFVSAAADKTSSVKKPVKNEGFFQTSFGQKAHGNYYTGSEISKMSYNELVLAGISFE